MNLDNELFLDHDDEKWIRLRDAKSYEKELKQQILKEVKEEMEQKFGTRSLLTGICEIFVCSSDWQEYWKSKRGE